jgi:hypothetical protein
MKFARFAFLLTAAAVTNSPASAAETSIDVIIKNHQFTPAEIHVPAHQAVVLTIKNEDSLAEEFDSTALKVEKVIAGGKQGTVRLRPLERGRYPFMGEYHADTAQGVVIAE